MTNQNTISSQHEEATVIHYVIVTFQVLGILLIMSLALWVTFDTLDFAILPIIGVILFGVVLYFRRQNNRVPANVKR